MIYTKSTRKVDRNPREAQTSPCNNRRNGQDGMRRGIAARNRNSPNMPGAKYRNLGLKCLMLTLETHSTRHPNESLENASQWRV